MTKSRTESYQVQIIGALGLAGWELQSVEMEEEWYAVSHLTFTSRRQAYGLNIILSFMVDPEDLAEAHVWNILAGSRKPQRYMRDDETFAEMILSRGKFDVNLKAFTEEINEYRNMQDISAKGIENERHETKKQIAQPDTQA